MLAHDNPPVHSLNPQDVKAAGTQLQNGKNRILLIMEFGHNELDPLEAPS